MIAQLSWVQRTWRFDFPAELFPCILERFRGTPARIEDIVLRFPPSVLTARIDDAWSIQEHVGHLYDLEELGEQRLHDFRAAAPVLSAADMQNRKTWEANHNEADIRELLRKFGVARDVLTAELEQLSDDHIRHSALHPRLNTKMRLVDWVYFMSEHDDHHLARITAIGRTLLDM